MSWYPGKKETEYRQGVAALVFVVAFVVALFVFSLCGCNHTVKVQSPVVAHDNNDTVYKTTTVTEKHVCTVPVTTTVERVVSHTVTTDPAGHVVPLPPLHSATVKGTTPGRFDAPKADLDPK